MCVRVWLLLLLLLCVCVCVCVCVLCVYMLSLHADPKFLAPRCTPANGLTRLPVRAQPASSCDVQGKRSQWSCSHTRPAMMQHHSAEGEQAGSLTRLGVREPAQSSSQQGDMDTLLRVALTHDALQKEVQLLRDEAGRWACEFEAAVNVSMDLKEQVEVLQQDHDKILNTPRSAYDDEGDAVSYELARRKSEVGKLKKKVRQLQDALALATRDGQSERGAGLSMDQELRRKDARITSLGWMHACTISSDLCCLLQCQLFGEYPA